MSSELFRQAWGNFATGVCLVNTLEENGEIHGMTANGVASISLDPMLVMVSVAHKANTYPIMKKTQRYVINILSENKKAIPKNPINIPTLFNQLNFSFSVKK